jgi:phage terminase large subunit-like protein
VGTPAAGHQAAQRQPGAVVNGELTHSGDSRLARHVGNAVLRQDAGGAWLAKERPDSPRKVDAAAAAVMAHDRAAVLAEDCGPSIYV